MKKILTIAALLAINYGAYAQANYWKFGSTYFDCNSGVVASAPTSTVDLDAATFAVPGLCNTYYKASWDFMWGPPHYTALHLYDVSANTSGHPFSGTGDVYTLIDDGSYYSGTSVAVAPIKNGTRKIYATYSNLIKVWTVNGDGTISGPSTLYTHPGSDFTDSRTETEVSSDGKYLLINSLGSPSSSLRLFDLTTNTLTNYPLPGVSGITGFEYVASWSVTPRLYVSYNDCDLYGGSAANNIGLGYFEVGTPGTLNSVSPPSGVNIKGFGFSEVELAKDGKLYIARNTSHVLPLTSAATLYSLTSGGTWGTVASLSIPFGSTGNWGYALQKQIDGENYTTAATYPTPTVIPITVKLNGAIGFTGPSLSVATVYSCIPDFLTLEADISGLMSGYELTITKGTLTSSSFISSGSSFTYVKAVHSGSLSGYIVTGSTPMASWGECDLKLEIKPKSACGGSSVHTVYYKFRYPPTVASTTNIKSVAGSTTPLYSASPVYRCGSEPWLMDYTITGLGTNGYDVTVTKGEITLGNAFVADGAAIPVTKGAFSYGGSGVFTISLFSSFVDPAWVGSDWMVEVTPRSICGATTETLVRYFRTQNASVMANYFAYRTKPAGSGFIDNNKPLQTTPSITSSMPSGATLTAFKTALAGATGWAGATTVGINDIDVDAGAIWSLKVYEVDGTTGIRMQISGVDVPNACYYEGVDDYSGLLQFSDFSRGFKPSSASTGYVDLSTGYLDGYTYFDEYYEWAMGVSTAELTAFSAKTWCTEFSVTNSTGCTVVNKGFFRIASTSLTNGKGAKTTDQQLEDKEILDEISLYPNPASGLISIKVPHTREPASIRLMDNTGRLLQLQNSLHSGKNELNIEHLSSGIYFYEINVNNTIKRGKLVKQ
ncbi:MAG: T9SS type A sorting domain-containing protein [Chitinophagaceae bacterium]